MSKLIEALERKAPLDEIKTILNSSEYLNTNRIREEEDTKNFLIILAVKKASNRDVIQLLIESGANVNILDYYGNSAMHYVDSKEVAELLIESGADVRVHNKRGNTPLHCVSNKEIITLLIEKGADVNFRNRQGGAPLHYAENVDIARILIEKGADLAAKNIDGFTPLYFARNHNIAELLINSGADINERNISGNTPLHFFCMEDNGLSNSNFHKIKLMLSYPSIEVDVKNNKGMTAEMLLKSYNYTTKCEELIDDFAAARRLSNARLAWMTAVTMGSHQAYGRVMVTAAGTEFPASPTDSEASIHAGGTKRRFAEKPTFSYIN